MKSMILALLVAMLSFNGYAQFDIAINSRGFGDPPYEGPEYEKYINVENQ